MDQRKLDELEQLRQAEYKIIRRNQLIGFPALFLGLGLFVAGLLLDILPLLIAGIPVFVVGLIFLGLAGARQTKLRRIFKSELVSTVVKDIYPESTYNMNQGLSQAVIMEPGFFKKPDRFTSEDYLKASYNGVPFEMSEFDCKERHEHHDSKGNTTVTYETYAKGRMIIIDFKREINDTVKVLETKWLGANLHGLKKVEMESIEFNKKFSTYSSNPLTTFYLLTPQVQLKLLELESKFKGSIFFAYQGGKFYVVINDNQKILEVNPSKPLQSGTIDILTSQLELPAAIINELKFDKGKYTMDQAL